MSHDADTIANDELGDYLDNLSGLEHSAYVACHPLKQWIDDMHEIAENIKKEMDKLIILIKEK